MCSCDISSKNGTGVYLTTIGHYITYCVPNAVSGNGTKKAVAAKKAIQQREKLKLTFVLQWEFVLGPLKAAVCSLGISFNIYSQKKWSHYVACISFGWMSGLRSDSARDILCGPITWLRPTFAVIYPLRLVIPRHSRRGTQFARRGILQTVQRFGIFDLKPVDLRMLTMFELFQSWSALLWPG